MIQAVIFDVDDTLYDQKVPFIGALLDVFADKLPSLIDQTEVYTRFRFHSDAVFSLCSSGQWSLERMRIYRIRETLKELHVKHIEAEEALAFQTIYDQKLQKISLQPEMKLVLDFLAKQKIPLEIITNGPTTHQKKKIFQLGVTQWISPESIFISESCGFEKPQRQIFDLARSKLRIPPENCLYIGDSYENDVIGANHAGWQVLWLNHRQRSAIKESKKIKFYEQRSFKGTLEKVRSLLQISEGECDKTL